MSRNNSVNFPNREYRGSRCLIRRTSAILGTDAAPLLWKCAMEDKSEFSHCAEMLGALAAPERLRIVRLLRAGPRSVGDIATEVGIKVVNASHHLTVLRHAGLIDKQRHGRYILY